jgi:SAM-dependent methyltransferase
MNFVPSAACPSCGSSRTSRRGALPAYPGFAGRALARPRPGGFLHECAACSLKFRFPRLAKEEMDALYEQGGATEWEGKAARRTDWEMAVQWLREERKEQDLDVLDIGCYDGALLASLGEGCRKFGIEINASASARAAARGIRIIGDDFSAVERSPVTFNAILAIDVIEHVEDPLGFLGRLAGALRRHGVIVIATGNADCLSWRLMGSRYWYSAFGEHISFVNPRWCTQAAQHCALEVEKLATFAHGSCGAARVTSDLIRNLSYRCAPAVWRQLRRWGIGGHDARAFPELVDYPPAWTSARDHLICRFRKY